MYNTDVKMTFVIQDKDRFQDEKINICQEVKRDGTGNRKRK